jgi:hypothetical protein
MTIEEYYAAVKRLGLVRYTLTVYIHLPTGESYNVPDPTGMTPAGRARTIGRLKALLRFGTAH